MRSLAHSIVAALAAAFVVVGGAGCPKHSPSIGAEGRATAAPSSAAKHHRPGIDDTAVEVRFGHAKRVVGGKVISSTTVVQQYSISRGVLVVPDQLEILVDKQQLSERENLAVDGDVVTKRKVHFTADIETTTTNGELVARPSVVEGKTYVVELKGTEIVVTTETGAAVSTAEAEFVAKRFTNLGTPDYVGDAIPTSIKAGERVPAMATAIAKREMHAVKDVTVSAVAVDFWGTESRGEIGVFGVTLTITIPAKSGEYSTTFVQTGQLRYRTKDSWDVEQSMSGTMTMKSLSPPGRGHPFAGDGTSSFHDTTIYR